MRKIACALLGVLLLLAAGCASYSGNREFVPGRGWVPVASSFFGR